MRISLNNIAIVLVVISGCFSGTVGATEISKTGTKKKVTVKPAKMIKHVENTAYTKNLKLIDFIAGKNKDKRYYPRAKAIQKINSRLSEREIKAVYQFLDKKLSDDVLKSLEFNSLKNELVLVIMSQNAKQAGLGTKLVEMFNNSKFNAVWRDYCIQFMGRIYKEATPKEQQQMLTTMKTATKESGNGIAGAALIALNSNIGQTGITPREVRIAAFEVVSNKKTPDYVKLTALQICAMRKEHRVLPIAKEILKTSKHVPLKMSAIATIGMLGSGNDYETLNKLAKSTDIRLRVAANSAIKRLGLQK